MSGYRPCDACGEETLNPDFCRDCAIEKAFEDMSCAECGSVIFGEMALTVLGLAPYDHRETCVSGAADRARGQELVAKAIAISKRV